MYIYHGQNGGKISGPEIPIFPKQKLPKKSSIDRPMFEN